MLTTLNTANATALTGLTTLLYCCLVNYTTVTVNIFLSDLARGRVVTTITNITTLLLTCVVPDLHDVFATNDTITLTLFATVTTILDIITNLHAHDFALNYLAFTNYYIILATLFLLRDD